MTSNTPERTPEGRKRGGRNEKRKRSRPTTNAADGANAGAWKEEEEGGRSAPGEPRPRKRGRKQDVGRTTPDSVQEEWEGEGAM